MIFGRGRIRQIMKLFPLFGLFSSATIAGCAVSQVQSPPAPTPATAPDPQTKALLQQFSAAPQFWQQAQIGERLVEQGDKSAIPVLLPLLRAPSRDLRINAARVLAGLGDDRGLFAVLAVLEDKSPRPTTMLASNGINFDVNGQIEQDRYRAAQALAVIGDARARPALEKALGDPVIDYQAAIMLGHLGDKRAIPALVAALKRADSAAPKSPNTEMKLWAAYGLLALGDARGTREISALMLNGKQWTTRRHAAEALSQWGDARAVAALIEATTDTQLEVRVNAITALGRIGDKRALPALQSAARNKNPAQAAARIGFKMIVSEQPTFERVSVSQAANKAIARIKAGK